MSSIQPGYHTVTRGPGALSVVLLSIITSVMASAVTVIALDRYGIPGVLPKPEAPAAPTIVEVPELAGMRKEAAEEILRARGLRLIVEAHRADGAVANTVITQAPLSGSQVRSNDPVAVTLSSGPALVAVPEVVSRSLEEAKRALEEAGLTLAEIRPGSGGEPGTVTAASPAPGQQVAPGAAVTLEVAEEARVKVPNVVGMHVRKAKERIAKAGLPIGDVRERYDRRKRGYLVLEQSPGAGVEVAKDTQVALVINQGD